jgi:signal peptidase I
MSNNNQPPFRVGQRIVAIKDSIVTRKGDIVVVKNIFKLSCCDIWLVYWGVDEPRPYNGCHCHKCGKRHPVFGTGKENLLGSEYFAPITEQYADIREELVNQVVIGDTVDQEVRKLVNN